MSVSARAPRSLAVRGYCVPPRLLLGKVGVSSPSGGACVCLPLLYPATSGPSLGFSALLYPFCLPPWAACPNPNHLCTNSSRSAPRGGGGGRATPQRGLPPPPASLSSPPPPPSDAASSGRVFGGQRPPQAEAPQRFL